MFLIPSKMYFKYFRWDWISELSYSFSKPQTVRAMLWAAESESLTGGIARSHSGACCSADGAMGDSDALDQSS